MKKKLEKTLVCIKSPLDKQGKKLFNLTVGKEYRCIEYKCIWIVFDDKKGEVKFFDTSIIFDENQPT